jgi:hypothetical protein
MQKMTGGWVKSKKQAAANQRPQSTLFALKNRTDKNSTSAALSGFAGAIGDVPLLDGISLRSEEKHVIWNQSTRARAKTGGTWI